MYKIDDESLKTNLMNFIVGILSLLIFCFIWSYKNRKKVKISAPMKKEVRTKNPEKYQYYTLNNFLIFNQKIKNEAFN